MRQPTARSIRSTKASAPSMWWSSRKSSRRCSDLADDLGEGRGQPHPVHQPRRHWRRPARAGGGAVGGGVRGRVRGPAGPPASSCAQQRAEPAQIVAGRHAVEGLARRRRRAARRHGHTRCRRRRAPRSTGDSQSERVDQRVDHATAEHAGERGRQRQMRDQIVPVLDPQQRHGIARGEAPVADARGREHDRRPHRGAGLVQAAGGQRGQARRRRCGR